MNDNASYRNLVLFRCPSQLECVGKSRGYSCCSICLVNQYCRQHKSVVSWAESGGVISIGQITLGLDLLLASQAVDHPCEQHDATSLNQMLRKQQRKRSPRRQFL